MNKKLRNHFDEFFKKIVAKCWHLLGQCNAQLNDCASIWCSYGKTLSHILHFSERTIRFVSPICCKKVSF